MRKTEKRDVVCLSDKGGLEMKQKDIDRREAEARANGVDIENETTEKWEEERSRIEDEALKKIFDYFSRRYDVKTYNFDSKKYEVGGVDPEDELVDFCVVFTNGTDRFQVYTAGEEAKLYKITTEHDKGKFITEFERLWTEDQTAEEMAESGIALIEEAINYAKTWEDKSFGARLRTIFK